MALAAITLSAIACGTGGFTLSAAGDVNGDGFADMVLSTSVAGVRRALVVFGGAGGLPASFDVADIGGAVGAWRWLPQRWGTDSAFRSPPPGTSTAMVSMT